MFRNFRMTTFAALTAVAMGAVGCNDSAPGVTPTGPTTNPTLPTGTTSTNGTLDTFAGQYTVTSPLNFAAHDVFPGPISDLLNALTELNQKPGSALLDIVNAFSPGTVPSWASSDLVKGLLNGFLTDALSKYVKIQQITMLVSGVTELANSMNMHEVMTVHTPAANGTVNIEQQLASVDFMFLDQPQSVPVPTDAMVAAHTTMSGTLTPHQDSATQADADLTVGAGTFTMPIGEMLFNGAGPAVYQQITGDPNVTTLAAALNELADCPSFGSYVATQIQNSGILGSSSNIDTLTPIFTGICTAALTAIADEAEAAMKGWTLEGVKIDSGRAQLLDLAPTINKNSIDHIADQVSNGTWSWSIPSVGNPIVIPSTFSGVRTGSAN